MLAGAGEVGAFGHELLLKLVERFVAPETSKPEVEEGEPPHCRAAVTIVYACNCNDEDIGGCFQSSFLNAGACQSAEKVLD